MSLPAAALRFELESKIQIILCVIKVGFVVGCEKNLLFEADTRSSPSLSLSLSRSLSLSLSLLLASFLISFSLIGSQNVLHHFHTYVVLDQYVLQVTKDIRAYSYDNGIFEYPGPVQ